MPRHHHLLPPAGRHPPSLARGGGRRRRAFEEEEEAARLENFGRMDGMGDDSDDVIVDADTLTTILQACDLARQLETELCRSGALNIGLVKAMCREISAVFAAAVEQLEQWEAVHGEPADLLGGDVSEGESLVTFESPTNGGH